MEHFVVVQHYRNSSKRDVKMLPEQPENLFRFEYVQFNFIPIMILMIGIVREQLCGN